MVLSQYLAWGSIVAMAILLVLEVKDELKKKKRKGYLKKIQKDCKWSYVGWAAVSSP